MSSIQLSDVSLRYPVILGGFNRSLNKYVTGLISGQSKSNNDKMTFIDALKNINFELKSGDRLGLIGRNGAGSYFTEVLAKNYSAAQPGTSRSGTYFAFVGHRRG